MKKKIKKTVSLKKSIQNNKPIQVIFKIFLSVFIIYHLSVMFILSSHTSMAYEKFRPYMLPYAWTLRVNAYSWQFFSPNPGKDHHYFEYIVHYPSKVKKTFFWPPSMKESNLIFFNHFRLQVHTSYFFRTKSSRLVHQHFLPYLCSLHSEARWIEIKATVSKRPSFKEAAEKGYSFKPYKGGSVIFKSSLMCKNNKKTRKVSSIGITSDSGPKKKEMVDKSKKIRIRKHE